MLLYVVDDDEFQAKHLEMLLTQSGFSVEIYSSGQQAMRAIQRFLPDIVLLDRRLPDIDGLEILAWIRNGYGNLPVIILTNAILECDIREAFEAGVDDYVVKPPRAAELIARIKARLRRTKLAASSEAISFGPYVMRCSERAVYDQSGCRMTLSPKEYDIVEILATHLGCIVPRETVFSRVWGQSTETPSSRTLDTHIYRIRQRLNLGPQIGITLRVIYNQGYRLEHVPAWTGSGEQT